MMEWHSKTTGDSQTDTWIRGRFLEEWADPRAVKQLPKIFAHFDEADIWRALMETMDLYRWLAVETAGALGYRYPHKVEQKIGQDVLNLKRGLSMSEAVIPD